MLISRADIVRARDDIRDPWAISNGVLYSLCKRHPGHADLKASTAKMLIIGRTYAASAERGRSAGGTGTVSGDAFYTSLLPRALKRSRLDRLLLPLRNVRAATDEHVTAGLAVHWELMRVLRELTGLEKRSLASKYLHFHVPGLFFVYDSRADRALRRVGPKYRPSLLPLGTDGDPSYLRFVSRAMALREQLEGRFGVRLTPRQLDRLLLGVDARGTE